MNVKSEIALSDEYYNLCVIPKILHISKKKFYEVKQYSNFPKVQVLTPTFKLVSRKEIEKFAQEYTKTKRKDREHEILIDKLL